MQYDWRWLPFIYIYIYAVLCVCLPISNINIHFQRFYLFIPTSSSRIIIMKKDEIHFLNIKEFFNIIYYMHVCGFFLWAAIIYVMYTCRVWSHICWMDEYKDQSQLKVYTFFKLGKVKKRSFDWILFRSTILIVFK